MDNFLKEKIESQRRQLFFEKMNLMALGPEPEIETQYTKEAVCPYCGCEVSDSWEFGDHDTHDCDCGETFAITRDIDVTYCTSKMEA